MFAGFASDCGWGETYSSSKEPKTQERRRPEESSAMREKNFKSALGKKKKEKKPYSCQSDKP